ncbi:hypothetical protein LJK88_38035 [Paenibacillus sp. P26]|nr:hypothetical protein LJK88_38035 [Paenibacillus sp. P26]
MNRQQTTPEAMIFDLDGTLFQTETPLPAYHATFDRLRAEGLYEGGNAAGAAHSERARHAA